MTKLRFVLLPVLAVLLLLVIPAVSAETFTLTGTVSAITDGDTIKVLKDQTIYKIRLNAIDAPEHDQPYGQKATDFLSALILSKQVTVSITAKDRYGRYLGDVYLGAVYVNAELVKAGYAWHYVYYSKDPVLSAQEAEARKNGLGLWQDKNPVAPWDWRRQRKSRSRSTGTAKR